MKSINYLNMKNKLKIFYVASEVSPFTRAGELGDVSGALPKYLKNLGHEVRLMMPNYKIVNERKYILRDVIRLQGLEIKIGDEVFGANAKSAFIPDSKVQIYFLDNKFYFDRDDLYLDNKTGKEFKDNAERYLFFSIGCLETLKLLHWQPDIIHCNDWQTAIIPTLLKTTYSEDPFFKNTRTLLSVHNFARQGCFDVSVIQKAGFHKSLFVSDNQIENNVHINFLKVGLENADLLNAKIEKSFNVSPKKPEGRFGFQDILDTRKKDICPISNGIDEQVWNPENDRLIPFNYSKRDYSDKYRNKEELLNRFGLKVDEKSAVIGTIFDFTGDNEIDLFLATIEPILKLDFQLIIMASCEKNYQKRIKELQKKYQKKVGLEFNFDTSLLHLIIAGSDMSLIPFNSQPGGLYKLYSLAYGTIPIVRHNRDSVKIVENINQDTATGTGFVFNELEPNEIRKVIKNALEIYQQKEIWSTITQNAMKLNFSWKTSAQQYVKIYQRLMNTKKNK